MKGSKFFDFFRWVFIYKIFGRKQKTYDQAFGDAVQKKKQAIEKTTNAK